jgi:hypothetical protein
MEATRAIMLGCAATAITLADMLPSNSYQEDMQILEELLGIVERKRAAGEYPDA